MKFELNDIFGNFLKKINLKNIFFKNFVDLLINYFNSKLKSTNPQIYNNMNFDEVINYINANVNDNILNLSYKLLSLTQTEKLNILRYIGKNYPNLQVLNLSNNKIISLDNSLSNLVNLQELNLSYNEIPLIQIYSYIIITENLTELYYR